MDHLLSKEQGDVGGKKIYCLVLSVLRDVQRREYIEN